MLETFTASTFAPLIGQAFRVSIGPAGVLELTLIEATEHRPRSGPNAAAANRRTPFSILFRGPKDLLLPQKMYPFEHPAIGAFDLFIVPIGPDAEGLLYEAVFS